MNKPVKGKLEEVKENRILTAGKRKNVHALNTSGFT